MPDAFGSDDEAPSERGQRVHRVVAVLTISLIVGALIIVLARCTADERLPTRAGTERERPSTAAPGAVRHRALR